MSKEKFISNKAREWNSFGQTVTHRGMSKIGVDRNPDNRLNRNKSLLMIALGNGYRSELGRNQKEICDNKSDERTSQKTRHTALSAQITLLSLTLANTRSFAPSISTIHWKPSCDSEDKKCNEFIWKQKATKGMPQLLWAPWSILHSPGTRSDCEPR